MWNKLAFIVWKLPVCEVRISPDFSRVLWSCGVLSESSCRAVSAAGGLERCAPSPARRGRTPHGCALPAGQGERQRFDNFLAEDSFRFSSGLAFKIPWPLEEPQTLQVALTQVAGSLSAHGAAAAKASHCRAWAARRARPALRAAASDSGGGPGIVLVSFLQRSGRSLHHFQ